MEFKANESLIILYSYHNMNTEKIARVFSRVLDAKIKTPQEINSEELQQYNLIGFGSGIYSEKHHQYLFDLVDRMPEVTDRNAFIFSTYGAPNIAVSKEFVYKNHLRLREKLQSKGYRIVGEFGCAGLNTNSFLKLFGGINKGRPNAEDLENAAAFAENLKHY